MLWTQGTTRTRLISLKDARDLRISGLHDVLPSIRTTGIDTDKIIYFVLVERTVRTMPFCCAVSCLVLASMVMSVLAPRLKVQLIPGS